MHAHQHIDVAVIEVELNDNEQFFTLDGMVFGAPAWADDVYLLGYRRVPMTTEEAITLQRGEVVNPSIETSATGAAPRQKTFLYSAIARPGNSGGPIIAQDGRVIGLVVDHTEEPQSTNLDAAEGEGSEAKDDSQTQRRAGKPPGPPFYRGVPTNQIMRALEDLDFGGLAIVEDEN